MIRSARRSLLLTTALAGTLIHGTARAADLPVPTNAMEPGLTYNGANTRLDVNLNNTNRIINWNSFDVAANKVVNFTTADTASKYSVLNRVAPGDPSDIFGLISTSTSNIAVWLVNPSGITFGSGGAFGGGSLVLTTAAVSDSNWAAAIASADPASFLVPLTGAPVPVTDAMTGVTTGAITLANGSTIATTGGRFAAAAQRVTAGGTITATGSEAELVAAIDLALPFGAGSPLGVRIDKGTSVGKVTAAGTAQINADVIRLAGASTGAQAAYLLQVDDGAQLTASVAGGKVILAAGSAGSGVALGGVPANVSGAASIRYDGTASATGTGGSVLLNASGDITTTTANGTIGADLSVGLTAAGNIAEAASLTTTTGNVAVSSGGSTVVKGSVSAGGNYGARGASLTLGTAGTPILQQAKGSVQIAATNGLLSGLDGLTVQSGSAGAAAGIELIQGGVGGIVFAPGTELIGGTFAAGPPATYGYGADVVVTSIAAGQPLTLGNVHARALTLPGGLGSEITAGDIVVDDTLTLNTAGAIRLRSATSRAGDVALTATGAVTGLARSAAATDGRLATGYDRAGLAASAAGRTVTVSAATAQLGTVTAGTGTTVVAGEAVAVDAGAIDVTSATAANSTLRLTSTAGEVRLGTGSAGIDGTIAAKTSARVGSLTARTGNASATAMDGDVTGLALTAAATDGRLLAGYGRADLTAQAAAGTVAVTAASGNAQLGTILAGTGTTAAAGDQASVDAGAIDVAAATSFNGALRLTSTVGEVRLGSGTGGTDATADAATGARIGSLTATTGDVLARSNSGDVTGLALATAATDGRLAADYGRADLAAQAATGTVTVAATAGNAQLGTGTAGTGTTTGAGDQFAVDAQAIDAASVTTRNGALRLTSSVGEVRIATGTGGTDATVTAATAARIGSLTARTGNAAAAATDGDVTGLARATPATDGRLVAGYDRAGLAAQAAGKTVTVTATAGYAQLGTVVAGTGTATVSGDQIAADARAIDATTATAANGALRLTSTVGEVRAATGAGGTDATVVAATNARIGSLTARTGNASATATAGDVTGLALAAAATDGRLAADYGRADLAAQAATGTVTVTATAGNAQLGTGTAGTGTTTGAGDQFAVDAQAIDAASVITRNGALRLTSTVGEVRLGTGTGGTEATVDAATNARIGSLIARTGSITVIARAGDASGLALATPATDGRLVAGYGRADLTAQAANQSATVTATLGGAQLGTVTAGTGTVTGTGDQVAVDAQAIDVTSAAAQNAKLRLTSTIGEVRLVTGNAGTDGTVTGATDARIGSLTATTGGLAVTAGNGDVTGLILAAPAADGRLVAGYGRADLTTLAAGQGIAVTAASGSAQLGTASAGTGTTPSAGDQIAVDAQAIDVATATAANGALRLTSSQSEVRVASGTAGTDGTVQAATAARIGTLTARTGDVSVTATDGDATGLALAMPAGDGRLVATYGRADLTAQAADRTVAVTANAGYAQLGTVIAGTGTTTPAGDQIAADARAIDVITATAQNGALRLTSTVGDVRVASGHGGTGGTVAAATDARVGDLTTRTAGFAITAAAGDATGLALVTAATDSRPEAGYGLTTLDAGTTIRVAASDDVQLGTIHAATDIDIAAHPADLATATANEIAWAGGTVAATTGHYRITGGSVVLGAPGGIGQNAGADLIVRSLAGDIGGGAGLALAAGVGSTSAANPLILYSAATIALPGDSTLTAGAGRYADIGLAALAGMAIALGSASARSIGTATIDGTQPTGYRIDARLVLPNPITARKLVTAADLVIDTSGAATPYALTLDEAQSTAGGINLATGGDIEGHELAAPSAIYPDGLYQRTKLTAFDGVVTTSGFALLGTVTAGTGIDLFTTGGRLDAQSVVSSGGSIALFGARDLRMDSVVAHGDGGNGAATMLADATIPLSAFATPGTVQTAGDIFASTGGDVTGTLTGAPAAIPQTFGLASVAAVDGGVSVGSSATAAGKGLLALGSVTAGGTTAGHEDATLTGRQIDVATGIDATAGSTVVTARELGSQTQVGATIARATAANDVTIDIGYGTASPATADNGSLRVGTVQAITGDVRLTAQDGSITGLAGTADGLDPAHARAPVSAGGNVTATAGRLVQLSELSGQDVAIAAGDDVLADVARQGIVAHQDGAIDIAHLDVRGALTLTAAHGATANGVSGIRIGALASGLSDGGVASRAGTAALGTLGTLGDIVIADGLITQGDLAAAGVANIRAATLTSATGGISLTATGGDISGVVLPAAATDGRMLAGFGRADLTTLAADQPIAAMAPAGIVQLGMVTAGTGMGTSAGEQIAVDARAIDIATATARNGALRLTSTAGEVGLVIGNAGTDATIAAAADARIGTLVTRTGSILTTATGGDVTGLVLPAPAGDGRLVPAYDRADLTAQAFGTGVTVTAAAGTAQLGTVAAGTGDATAATGGIAVDARQIAVSTATAQNAAVRLTSSVGEVRLVTGNAGTDATIGAATNVRIGALTTRTGSILATATTGDVTGLLLAAPADDGRLVPAYDRANLTAQAVGTGVTVMAAAGTAQLGPVTAGTGDTTATTGGIAVDAAAIDVTTATAQNAGLRLTSGVGQVRLATGTAGTDAIIGAATSARIGALATRTGSIGITATAGDITGLALNPAASDGRMVPDYGRADLTTQAAGTNIAVTAAAGTAQLGTVTAGTGIGTAASGDIAVDARAIDVVSADAANAALRLTSTAGEVRLITGNAGTDATIGAATGARIGTLTTRTGSIQVTATGGDVTGLALAPAATDGRLVPDHGRAVLIAQAERTDVTVDAAGAVQLDTVTAGAGSATATSGGIAVTAGTIDLLAADARNAALELTATVGETRLVAGTAGTAVAILAAANVRIGTLAARTGAIAVTAIAGDVTGLVRSVPAEDGRLVADYDRADLTALAAAQPIAVKAAAGNVQLGTMLAGAGPDTSAGDQIAVDAQAIDVVTATARNGALRLASTRGEVRLATGDAGTDAVLAAAGDARIGTLTTRTGSIAVIAGTGDATGLALMPPAADGRMVPAYDRADLAAQAAGTNVAVTAAGTAQLGTVRAGADDGGTAASGGIAVIANAIDLVTANAQNAALQLTSTGGETRLVTGTAGTDATILAATAARIGTLTARTGSIAVAATAGDVTGLALAPAATDGRLVADYNRADLTTQGAGTAVTVTAAAGTVQLGTVTAGTGDAPAPAGGITVGARSIDIATAAARDAALRLASSVGEVRLASGTAASDAGIAAATNARIGTLVTRTGSIAVTAGSGDATGLALAPAIAADGRLAPDFGRTDLTAQASARNVTVNAAGAAQLGTVSAGAGDTTAAGGGIAVTAGAIDIAAAAAQNAALQLTSTTGETRLATGTAGTDATLLAAAGARIGTLAARTGSIGVTATAGDVTGLALATAMPDGRPAPGYGRADLTASAAAHTIAVTAAAGTAQLGTVSAGAGAVTTTGDQLTVTARAIDVTTATTQNGAMRLTSTAGDTRLGTGTAGTDATIDGATSARIESLTARTGAILVTARGTTPVTQGLYVSRSLKAPGAITLVSAGDVSLPLQAAAIVSASAVVLRNSGAGGTLIGAGADSAGFHLVEGEVNGIDAPRLTIDSADRAVGIGALAVTAAAGRSEVDLLGTGGVTIRGAVGNTGSGARTLQIGGAAAGADAPSEGAIEAGTTLAGSITAEIDNGASIDWSGGTVDLRAGTILFGNQALRTVAVGTPEGIAINLIARPNSALYTGALGTPLQNKIFLTALKLRVVYSGYALFQNTNLPAVPTGVVIGAQDRSVTTNALQLFSTGDTPANSFSLFGTINGFEGRTAGLLPAAVIDFADLSPRVVRITQANSRVNGCVVGSPDAGCLVTNSPPPDFQLFDERQILLFGTADDAGLTFDPLIGTNNESLIGDIDSAALGINSIDCSAPGTRDCPATGEKQ